jgi:hypothetical protein
VDNGIEIHDWSDRATLKDCLAQIDRQIAEGQETIVKLRVIVADLGGKGRHARAAEELLKQFESFQARLLADRDSLMQAIASLDGDDHEDAN